MSDTWKAALRSLLTCGVVAAALALVRREFQAVSWDVVRGDLSDIPVARLGAALVLTAASHTVLTAYDLIAVASIRRCLPRWGVVLTSFVAYAIAHNVGVAALSGAAERYRFHSRWGITPVSCRVSPCRTR